MIPSSKPGILRSSALPAAQHGEMMDGMAGIARKYGPAIFIAAATAHNILSATHNLKAGASSSPDFPRDVFEQHCSTLDDNMADLLTMLCTAAGIDVNKFHACTMELKSLSQCIAQDLTPGDPLAAGIEARAAMARMAGA